MILYNTSDWIHEISFQPQMLNSGSTILNRKAILVMVFSIKSFHNKAGAGHSPQERVEALCHTAATILLRFNGIGVEKNARNNIIDRYIKEQKRVLSLFYNLMPY